MRTIILPLMVLSAVAIRPNSNDPTCKCGLAMRSADRIIGGKPTGIFEYPWMVAIMKKKFSDKYIWCGGSLISDQWILTSAHCVKDDNGVKIPKEDIKVYLGAHWLSIISKAVLVKVDSIIPHRRHREETKDYDFALIKMESPVDFLINSHIRPVCLPEITSQDYAKYQAILTGWGRRSINDPGSNELMQVDMEVITNQQCKNAKIPKGVPITDRMICSFDKNKIKTVCKGDSGGPMITAGKGNGVTPGENYELIGVISWSTENCDPAYPQVSARVTSVLKNWIYVETKGSWKTCPRKLN